MKLYIKPIILCLLLVGAVATAYMDDRTRPDWKRISPFTAVDFEGDAILTEFEGTTYELVSIEGISSAELIHTSKRKFGTRWQKRIREDIAEVLIAAGVEESNLVDLELKDPTTGEISKFVDAEMTEGNRDIIYQASDG